MAALSHSWAGKAGQLKDYVRANPFAQKAIISFCLHVLVISGLLIWSFTSCRVRAPRNLSPFDLQSVGQPGKSGGGGAAPILEPMAVNRQEDGLEIVKKKPVKSKRKSAHVKIQSQPNKSTSPRIKPPSKSDLQKILGSALKGVGSGSTVMGNSGSGTGGGTYDPLNWYYSMVRSKMYEAWQQPSALAGTKGLMSRALIRVKRDGRIVRRSLAKYSGNALMDSSVMSAVESVQQLQPLPPGFGDDYKDITIDFKLSEPSLGE